MRKIAFVLLAALIAVGCGSSDDSEKETSSSMSSTTVIEETTTTEDEYVAPVDEEEDGYEEDDWDGAQQDSDRDTLVFLISGITGEDLGFVNVGFSGCVVDAVAEASGDDYSTALANVYSDDDAYSMEFEAAAISCISYLSAAELARLAEADDASDEDAPTVLDYDPQPVFSTLAEGEECGNQEYGRKIMIDGFCVNADICLDDPGHEMCGDPAGYDWTGNGCPISDIHGETVRYGESLCQPVFCINENPSHVLCDDPSNYDVEEIASVVIQDIVSGITDGDIEVSVRAQLGSTDTAKWAYRLPCSPEEVRTSDSRGNGDVYVRTYVAFEYSLEADFVIIQMAQRASTEAGAVEYDAFSLSWEGGDCAAGYNDQDFNVKVDVDAAEECGNDDDYGQLVTVKGDCLPVTCLGDSAAFDSYASFYSTPECREFAGYDWNNFDCSLVTEDTEAYGSSFPVQLVRYADSDFCMPFWCIDTDRDLSYCEDSSDLSETKN